MDKCEQGGGFEKELLNKSHLHEEMVMVMMVVIRNKFLNIFICIKVADWWMHEKEQQQISASNLIPAATFATFECFQSGSQCFLSAFSFQNRQEETRLQAMQAKLYNLLFFLLLSGSLIISSKVLFLKKKKARVAKSLDICIFEGCVFVFNVLTSFKQYFVSFDDSESMCLILFEST